MSTHVVLISIDNLRFDCVGYQPDKRGMQKYDCLGLLDTPTLDGLAARSACFTQCASTNTYTTGAHASAFTGLYPPRHGVRAFYRTKLADSVYTIAEIMRVFGYKTVFACDAPAIFHPLHLSKGFDHVLDGNDSGVLDFLAAHKDEKCFVFIHFFDVHGPFLFSKLPGAYNDDYFAMLTELYERHRVPMPGGEQDAWSLWNYGHYKFNSTAELLMPLYVRGVSKFDKNRFRAFIGGLARVGVLDSGLLIVFSDHGEGKVYRDQPGQFSHGGALYEDVIRVPLIVHHRDIGHRIDDRLSSLVDILPTVTEVALGKNAGELLPYRLDGISLRGTATHASVYAEKWMANNTPDHPLNQLSFFLWQRAIRTKETKAILYGEPEHFTEEALSRLDDAGFLKNLYRKRRCRFEEYDEYMNDLSRLKTGAKSRQDFLDEDPGPPMEFFDIVNDPDEECAMTDGVPPDASAAAEERIISLSTPAVETEPPVSPVNSTVVEEITRRILAEETEAQVKLTVSNKNLFNSLVTKFFLKHRDLPDEEFYRTCHAAFLNREPTPEECTEITAIAQAGYSRKTVFETRYVSKLFSDVSPAAEGVAERIEALTRTWGADIGQFRAALAEREMVIAGLQEKLAEASALLDAMRRSKTWRLSRLYGRLVGVEAEWRNRLSSALIDIRRRRAHDARRRS